MRVALYSVSAGSGYGNKRARKIARAAALGLARHGVQTQFFEKWDGRVVADVALAYGWVHKQIFSTYRSAGAHYVFWDLGYWHRRPKDNPGDGYHRVAVDDWDTAVNMRRGCPRDRLRALRLDLRPPSSSTGYVLVAGMSDKAAATHGFRPNEWESWAVRKIGSIDERGGIPIITRAKPVRGVRSVPLEEQIAGARLIVTHHSNVAIDALCLGVPAYAVKGVGSLHRKLASLTADELDRPTPICENQRSELLADVAYAQWRISEIERGEAWDYVRGLICAS